MKQGEKQLLLKDLSARLPYGVKFAITNEKTDTLKSIGIDKFGLIPINLFYKKPSFYLINEFGNIEYKPYLRPMSSMTEGEEEEWNNYVSVPSGKSLRRTPYCIKYMDWLLEHHFDFRHLIEKGLALEAPEGMYKVNEI